MMVGNGVILVLKECPSKGRAIDSMTFIAQKLGGWGAGTAPPPPPICKHDNARLMGWDQRTRGQEDTADQGRRGAKKTSQGQP